MKYTFGDTSDAKSRGATIRALFAVGSTINDLTEKCIDAGVWTSSEIRGLAVLQARAEVRAALGIITQEGIPFAGPTASRKGRSPIWRQMDFWSKVDFDYNYSAYKRREIANGKVAENIARVCEERFGAVPTYIDIDANDYGFPGEEE